MGNNFLIYIVKNLTKMKFIILGTLVAVASAIKLSRGEQAHNTIFESCSSNRDCPSNKYCNLDPPIKWYYCQDKKTMIFMTLNIWLSMMWAGV